jgi:DNA modification methylase
MPKTIKLASLKPNPDNPRYITEAKFEALKRSIRDFPEMMALRPMVVDDQGTVLGGNMRLKALAELGYQDIPADWVVKAKDLTEDQRREFIVKDNIGFGDWDWEAIGNDWSDLPLEDWGLDVWEPEQEAEAKVTEDEVPEPPTEPITKPGDLWMLGEHRLLCGDATKAEDVERLMDGAKADLWLTDPPYGVAYESAGRRGKDNQHKEIENDSRPLDEMAKFWEQAASLAYQSCSDSSSYYWFACQGGDQMIMMISISRAKWRVRHELIWVKDQMVFGRCDYHYKHEPILYGWKQEGTHEWNADRKQVSVLEFDRPKRSDEHPTMKPVALVAYLLGNNTTSGESVLDTFLGSGTTLIAAEQLGRKCYGMEISPQYCDVIVKRWETLTGKKAKNDRQHPTA